MEELSFFKTQDGSDSVHSERFGVSYHSKYGAIQESRHVFLKSGLYTKLQALDQVSVLETGFGTGLNALLTCLEANAIGKKVSYVALEAYPLPPEKALKLNYPDHLNKESSAIFKELHNCAWESPTWISKNFSFEKRQVPFESFSQENAFDVVYYDAFAPNAQPELWEAPVLGRMYRALKNGGIIVTYCAKGAVKRCLKDIGFEVESLPGPPGKREMTRGVKV